MFKAPRNVSKKGVWRRDNTKRIRAETFPSVKGAFPAYGGPTQPPPPNFHVINPACAPRSGGRAEFATRPPPLTTIAAAARPYAETGLLEVIRPLITCCGGAAVKTAPTEDVSLKRFASRERRTRVGYSYGEWDDGGDERSTPPR